MPSVDAMLGQVISTLQSGYVGEEGRATCVALLEEARAEITRQLPRILNQDVKDALMGRVR